MGQENNDTMSFVDPDDPTLDVSASVNGNGGQGQESERYGLYQGRIHGGTSIMQLQ